MTELDPDLEELIEMLSKHQRFSGIDVVYPDIALKPMTIIEPKEEYL